MAAAQSTISRDQPFLVVDNAPGNPYTLKAQDPKFIDLNGDGFQQLPGEVSIPQTGFRPIFTNTPLPFPALNPSPSVVFSPIAPNNTVAGNTGVGNTRPNINVFKYEDLNANGRYDPQFLAGGAINITGNGERPLGGVQVFIDLNNDGVLQAGEPTRTTDLNGRAVFQNLTPGTYTVREIPGNLLPSTPAAVTFSVNTEDANVTFGNTPKSKITGCKFEDFNQNGYRDGNEPPISGITVYLDANNNGILDQGELRTTTDQFGSFTFDNLNPGTYSLREDRSSVPSNFKQTTQPLEIVLGPNQTFTCALIGNVRLYDLLVPKFQDDNRDGIQNGNEQSLNNVPFALDLNENGSYDVGEPLARTGADGAPFGKALFKDLLPGTYSVLEVFNDPRVPNPFPIRTGPNPVSFDVPGSGDFTVPSPVRPPATPELAMNSLDLLTGDTGVAAASIDPLTNGGSSDAVVQASSVDSLIAPETAGVSSFIDFNGLKDAAEASIVTFLEAQKLDEPKLLLGAPTTTPLF
ncbi:collagen binding domain-containing protein [Microcoleus sp.]|uniref:MSCRAMM family protein n=1 Tax=Microcoleus sp. TaxID=44472 RepID=UPI0035939969